MGQEVAMTDGAVRRQMTRRVVLGMLGMAALPVGRARASGKGADADRAALVTANTEFGLALYGRLVGGQGNNAFFSPFSVSNALAMTYAGARGATADEMARALRFSLPPGRVHPAFAALIREVNGADRKRASELYTANALWSQKGVPFVPDFQQIGKDSYQAALEEVDFQGAPETARRTINAWVERQTQDKIKELLREGMLGRDTVLVLTNAIYFKGTWANRFAEGATQPGDFELGAGGTARNVPLMRQHARLRYLDGDGFQVLELPYDAHEMSMLVVLPRRSDGLPDAEKGLTAARVGEWLSRLTLHDVDVTLPRFKVTATFDLTRPLKDLGMARAFSSGADFSGMVKERPVSVSAVVHKAYVDVNERGTEAAAATAAAVRTTSAHSPSHRAVFRADHPFLFFIRDNRTGSLLFAGRLTNPATG
jgi:serpin B